MKSAQSVRVCVRRRGWRNPITGIGCCARAASGHAAARRRHDELRAVSFDHLVGAGEQRGGTTRPSILAVWRLMTSSNLVGLHDRQVRRLGALEDAAGIDAGLTNASARFAP